MLLFKANGLEDGVILIYDKNSKVCFFAIMDMNEICQYSYRIHYAIHQLI